MNVLTIYANPNPKSFCHAVLEQFTKGLADAGHHQEVVDLYGIGFDPVLQARDFPSWMDADLPQEILDRADLRNALLDSAHGPISRFLIKRWIGKKDARAIIRALRKDRIPKDVLEQQAKVSRAQVLVFISPVWFVGLPTILKGWIERVFTLGFAFGLTADGWRGDLSGRIPLLKLDKALIINTTLFDKAAYQSGLGAAMKLLIDDFTLSYPGIKQVEHEYLYAVYGASDETRRGYLKRAYRLGKELTIARNAGVASAVASAGVTSAGVASAGAGGAT